MAAPEGLYAALADFQAKVPTVTKDSAAIVPTKSGGAYGYKYADLAALSAIILPLLGKHGLSFTARPTIAGGRFVLLYTLAHVSGEEISGEYPLPESGSPQAIGSAITYARRYCLTAVTGVAPADEDDDAAAAEAEHQPVTRTRARVTGAEHERLRNGAAQGYEPGAQHLPATPPDDPWYDAGEPGMPLPEIEGRPGTIDVKNQMPVIGALFGQIGITDRDERLAMTAELVGRKVPTSSALSYQEAGKLISELRKRAAAPADAS